MHQTPIRVVPRRDLWIDGFLVHARYIINVHSFDRETGGIVISVAPPGSSLCTERVTIPRNRYPEFSIRWEWTTSTELGGRLIQLAALAYLAPIWITSDLLRASPLPGFRKLGNKLHPKRGQ